MKVKNTILFIVALLFSAGIFSAHAQKKRKDLPESVYENPSSLKTGADNYALYLPQLQGKRVGLMTNQTGVVLLSAEKDNEKRSTQNSSTEKDTVHLVDFLLSQKINLKKVYAPEHGFRGKADAGELIKDGKDAQTGLPIISLYGKSKKPSKEQLNGIDIMVFDLQDVGARFYTYISSLHYVMEACAEQNIPILLLDRPNPNKGIVDGPILEKQYQSFVGMHPVPVLHGMTIGEYAQMINGEKWLKNGVQCELTVIACTNYDKSMRYRLPVSPSPNLPNDQSINLYVSLCFFEGTQVSSGRGTNKQFQIYGSPYLKNMPYQFTPQPNEGAKDPMNKGVLCYGEDLSSAPRVEGIALEWLLRAYQNTSETKKVTFFTKFFENLAGTAQLRKQIQQGYSAAQIKKTWQQGLQDFQELRKPYLIYEDVK